MPLTQAERAKRYRENHKTAVRERDNLRKKHQREVLKALNPGVYKERLKKQSTAKALYRTKIKLREAQEKLTINTEPQSSSNSAFSHSASKARSLRKAASALPKSPCKKVEIVKSLAKQFQLKIRDHGQSVGRPKNSLTDNELEWLSVFFERPDITYTLPGIKDHKYTGKVNGESTFAQKRYLLWTLGEIVDILNGMPLSGAAGSFFLDSQGK